MFTLIGRNKLRWLCNQLYIVQEIQIIAEETLVLRTLASMENPQLRSLLMVSA